MKCVRCFKDFDTKVPEMKVESYGGISVYVCPHCGKPYKFFSTVTATPINIDYPNVKEDDYGNRIVSDDEFYEKPF